MHLASDMRVQVSHFAIYVALVFCIGTGCTVSGPQTLASHGSAQHSLRDLPTVPAVLSEDLQVVRLYHGTPFSCDSFRDGFKLDFDCSERTPPNFSTNPAYASTYRSMDSSHEPNRDEYQTLLERHQTSPETNVVVVEVLPAQLESLKVYIHDDYNNTLMSINDAQLKDNDVLGCLWDVEPELDLDISFETAAAIAVLNTFERVCLSYEAFLGDARFNQ